MIHSLISIIELADEDGDFVTELMREGTDGALDTSRPDEGGASDSQ